MNVPGEHELDLADPLLEGLGLGLRLLVVLFEVVWEVSVQIKSSGIVPSLASLTRALTSNLYQNIDMSH